MEHTPFGCIHFSSPRHGDNSTDFRGTSAFGWPFFVHDLGYWKANDLEGPEGEKHVYLGARILRSLFGDAWGEFCVRHSRYWSKKQGCKVSRLAAADKLAFVLTPWWLYLPMVSATGELTEYMAVSRERQADDCLFTESERILLSSGKARSWLIGLHKYTRRWVEENKNDCLRVDQLSAEQPLANTVSVHD